MQQMPEAQAMGYAEQENGAAEQIHQQQIAMQANLHAVPQGNLEQD